MSKIVSVRDVNLGLLLFNVVGAVVYMVQASVGWRNPAEHGMIPVTGEPIVWFGAIVPILAIYPLLNFVLAAFILVRRQWRSGRFWLMTAAVWVCAIAIDFAHH